MRCLPSPLKRMFAFSLVAGMASAAVDHSAEAAELIKLPGRYLKSRTHRRLIESRSDHDASRGFLAISVGRETAHVAKLDHDGRLVEQGEMGLKSWMLGDHKATIAKLTAGEPGSRDERPEDHQGVPRIAKAWAEGGHGPLDLAAFVKLAAGHPQLEEDHPLMEALEKDVGMIGIEDPQFSRMGRPIFEFGHLVGEDTAKVMPGGEGHRNIALVIADELVQQVGIQNVEHAEAQAAQFKASGVRIFRDLGFRASEFANLSQDDKVTLVGRRLVAGSLSRPFFQGWGSNLRMGGLVIGEGSLGLAIDPNGPVIHLEADIED